MVRVCCLVHWFSLYVLTAYTYIMIFYYSYRYVAQYCTSLHNRGREVCIHRYLTNTLHLVLNSNN